MKKSILFSLLVLVSTVMFAQDDSTDSDDMIQPKNEVKANALYLVLGAFDVSYERLLNEESAVGLNVVIPFDEDIRDDLNYFISPYYRMYFGKKYASGFFLEGFGLLSSVNERNSFLTGNPLDPTFVTREETETNFALGIGLGGKWVTNSGFIGELNLGLGRNLTNTGDDSDDFVGKVGITVGYRF
ncbi:DUF3575 domain-containing protein [Psychroserpens sp. MEBiC05023]